MSSKKKKLARQRFEVLPGEGKKFSFTVFRQAAAFYILLLLVLVVLVQFGYHWLGEQFLVWRLQVIEAEIGVMRQEVAVEGVVTRHEAVITAPANAVVLKLAPDGERIARGEELARLGIISAIDMRAIREAEDDETREQFLQQLQDYFDSLFTDQIESEEIAEDEPDENEEATDADPALLNQPDQFEDVIIIYNENPGFVSYYTDGFESEDGPFYDYFDDDDDDDEEESEDSEPEVEPEAEESQDDLEAESNTGMIIAEGSLVEVGQPLIKIVDNWQWFFSTVLPLHPGRTLTLYDKVGLEFDFAPGQTVQGLLYHSEIDEENHQVRLTYVINRQLESFERVRFTGAALLYRQQQGIIVPESAVFEKEGITGLYINQGGRIVFKPVTVVEKQDELVMIEGLDPFSFVISRPDLVEEGQRFR